MAEFTYNFDKLNDEIVMVPRPNVYAKKNLTKLVNIVDEYSAHLGKLSPLENFALHTKVLSTATTLVVTHMDDEKVDGEIFARLCAFTPHLAGLYKTNPQYFELHKTSINARITDLMSADVRNSVVISENGQYLAGQPMGPYGTTPFIKKTEDSRRTHAYELTLDEFHGNRAEALMFIRHQRKADLETYSEFYHSGINALENVPQKQVFKLAI